MTKPTKLAGVAMVAGVAAAVVGAAGATAPAKSGMIAFQRFAFQDHPVVTRIVVANPDGSGQRGITHAPNGYIDGEPDWSPDGTRVAFQRCASDESHCAIWSAKVDGSGARRVTSASDRGSVLPKCLEENSPAYSPDGKLIAFECFTRPSANRLLFSIVVMDGQGHNRRVVVHGSAGAGVGRPQFSPDGGRLVFDHQNIGAKPKNGHATYVVNLDGTGMRRVTPWHLRAGDHPDWSPDGTRILVRSLANGPDFLRQGNLYTVRPDGTGLRKLTHFPSSVNLLQNGSFSPDGTSIVFATSKDATKTARSNLPDIFTMRVDGSGIRPVTRLRNWDGSPDWGSGP